MKHFVLYKHIMKKNPESFFSCDNVFVSYFLEPQGNAITIEREEDAQYANKTYCMQLTSKDFTMTELFSILANKMPIEDLEVVLSKDEWLNEMFCDWLKGGGCCDRNAL